MIMYASAGNRSRDPLLSSVSLKQLGYRERYRHVVRSFTKLFDQTIPQELCIVCKAYKQNKNKRTLFTYSFVIDTIQIQDDLYKRRIFYVLYVNDYI